jgi:hypothetical protein
MRRVFAAPLALAAVSAFGLLAAFAFGDIGRGLCWFGVGAPVAVIAWSALRRQAGRPPGQAPRWRG